MKLNNKIANYIDATLVVTFIAILLFTSITISYYGNPISDESFPFATAMRFLQGQKPFADDMSPFIPLAFILIPIVKLSLLVHHGKNELILFSRHVYIFFQLILGFYAFQTTRKYLPTLLAIFCGIIVALYHPFGLNNFHYDTLATSLWTTILFQFFTMQFSKPNRFDYLTFSIANVFLFFVYPTFAFYLIPLYVFLFFSIQNNLRFWSTHVAVATLVGLMLLAVIFGYFNVSMQDIQATIAFNHQLFQFYAKNHSFLGKCFIALHNITLVYYKYFLLSVLVLGVVRIITPYWKSALPLGIAVTLLLILLYKQPGIFAQHFYYLNCIGLIAPLLYCFFLRKNKLALKIFYYLWIPSLLAGILTSTTSTNFELNFNIGFFPAYIITFMFIYFLLQEYSKFLLRVALLVGVSVVAYIQLDYVYGVPTNGLFAHANSVKYKIPGPFHGIYLDPLWSKHLNQLQQAITQIDNDTNQYIYFGPVSGGYLLIDKLKAGEALLFCPYHINHLNLKIKLPSYIFYDVAFLSPFGSNSTYTQNIPYQKIMTSEYFEVYHLG